MANKHLPKLTVCQNCETPTTGNFCPECGQDCRDHRVGLRLLLVGLWNDLFTFDNRFWHSFLILLTQPGELTRRYMGGKRVRYIPPARMYLFVSIIFFFVLSAIAEKEAGERPAKAPRQDTDVVAAQVDSTIRARISQELDQEEDKGRNDGKMVTVIGGQKRVLDKEKFIGTMLNLAPKGMFLILPLFAGVLALIYVRGRRLFVEHFIFALHFHTVVYVGFLLGLLVPGNWFRLVVGLILLPLYLYLAMKKVYGQGWLKTWLKHFLLLSAYNVVLMIFLTLLAVGGVYLSSWAMEHPRWSGLIF